MPINGDTPNVDLFAPLPQLEGNNNDARPSSTDEGTTVDLFATEMPAGDANLLGSEPSTTATGEVDLFGQPAVAVSENVTGVDLFGMIAVSENATGVDLFGMNSMMTTTPALPESSATVEDPFASPPVPISGSASVSDTVPQPVESHHDDTTSVVSAPPVVHRQDVFGSLKWASEDRSKSMDHHDTSAVPPNPSELASNSSPQSLPSQVHVPDENDKETGAPPSAEIASLPSHPSPGKEAAQPPPQEEFKAQIPAQEPTENESSSEQPVVERNEESSSTAVYGERKSITITGEREINFARGKERV